MRGLWCRFLSLADDCVNRVSAHLFFFFLMMRRPPRSTLDRSSAASDVYKRQEHDHQQDARADDRPGPVVAEYVAPQGVAHLFVMVAPRQ